MNTFLHFVSNQNISLVNKSFNIFQFKIRVMFNLLQIPNFILSLHHKITQHFNFWSIGGLHLIDFKVQKVVNFIFALVKLAVFQKIRLWHLPSIFHEITQPCMFHRIDNAGCYFVFLIIDHGSHFEQASAENWKLFLHMGPEWRKWNFELFVANCFTKSLFCHNLVLFKQVLGPNKVSDPAGALGL